MTFEEYDAQDSHDDVLEVVPRPISPTQWLNLDVLAVIVFVAIGRDTHKSGSGIAGLLALAAPFLISLFVSWFVTKAWRDPANIRTGFIIWPLTVVLGMLLRRFAFDRGTATAFVIVATVFLGFTLIGWRLVAQAAMKRRLR
jgi:FtsH-binding integral membrane protein